MPRLFIVFLLLILPSSAFAERLSGINIQMTPFAATGELSNDAKIKNHIGIKGSIDKLFSLRGPFYVGPRVEAGNSYLSTEDRTDGFKVLSTYDNRFVTGGFRAGFWFGDDTLPNDIYLAAGFGRGYSKLRIDESGEDYYAQRDANKIEGRYQSLELGGNWHVRRGFSFNGALFNHLYDADQSKAKQSVDSEVATTKGIQLTSGEESPDLDDRVVQRTFGFAFGFTIGL
jgi:hypothetical protein